MQSLLRTIILLSKENLLLRSWAKKKFRRLQKQVNLVNLFPLTHRVAIWLRTTVINTLEQFDLIYSTPSKIVSCKLKIYDEVITFYGP